MCHSALQQAVETQSSYLKRFRMLRLPRSWSYELLKFRHPPCDGAGRPKRGAPLTNNLAAVMNFKGGKKRWLR
jgi:hypothetical protein